LEQELPYSIAVSIDEWKREGGLLKITATIAVERESQKGIVIGKGGHVLKTAGERARVELEQMLETKVFLKLFVRVEPDWTESEAGLRKAGVVNF
jgi:GTP-binding protein Era